ncbi:MAG: HEAT repeat domain-containing protein [Dermatophilaceae bacterium]
MAGGAVDRWREAIRATSDVEALLASQSRLPGPRGNLELASAYAEEAGPQQARRLVADHSPQVAPVNTPGEFLAFCGVIAQWRTVLAGEAGAVESLRSHASDPRWRVREAVAMALQRVGDDDAVRLVDIARVWARGNRLEQRAAVAALCEPRLLTDAVVAGAAFEVLDLTTASLVGAPDRRSDGFVALRKALGYGWSVLAVADWARVRPALERWQREPDPDVRWVMRQNLRKSRLQRLDPSWVDAALRGAAT